MIVPHGHERPAGPGVLQVRIGEITTIDRTIAVHRQRKMEMADLATVGDPRDLVDRPVVPRLHLVGIFDDLVDEVALVQDKTELVCRRRPLVLENHPAIGVERAFVDVLAADKGEVDRARIVASRRGDRSPKAAAVPVGVAEPIPVDPRWLEPADQHPRGPVSGRGDWRGGVGDHAAEMLVLRHLDREEMAVALTERPARPQDHAVGVGIPRGHAFRIEIAPFPPCHPRRPGGAAPRQGGPKARGDLDEFAAAQCHRLYLLSASALRRGRWPPIFFCRVAPSATPFLGQTSSGPIVARELERVARLAFFPRAR